jgi:L-alanine-DL-glutamate epimerase-like enolase superfamily enzyme
MHLRIGPEKGVIHIATGAVDNALWDLYARARQKPLWKLLVDMSSVRPRLRTRVDLSPDSSFTGGAGEVSDVPVYYRCDHAW